MEIPEATKQALIPHADLSVSQLIQFRVPICLESYEKPPSTTLEELYFYCSKDKVTTTDIATLYFIPSPPASIVSALQKILPAAVKAGANSVKCAHAKSAEGKTYPTWIITYWADIAPIRECRSKWLVLDKALRAKEKGRDGLGDDSEQAEQVDHGAARATEILEMLATTPWTQDLQGFSTNAGTSLITLTDYTTQNWFNDENANQALDLLRISISDEEHHIIQVTSTWFYPKLQQALGNPNKDAYLQETSFRSHRHMGESLETGIYDQLAMLINIERTHWVCAVLDFRGRTIHYGDSLGSPVPASISNTLNWWTHFHSGQIFTYQQLAITAQIDTHSCGLFAYNALAHHLLDNENLISARSALDGRIQILFDVLRRHHEAVSNEENLLLTSDDESSDSGLSYVSEAAAEDTHLSSPAINEEPPKSVVTVAQAKPRQMVVSAVRKGLSELESGSERRGLFQYFGEGTAATFKAHVNRETERSEMYLDNEEHQLQAAQVIKEGDLRERARVRKAKSRAIIKEREVHNGLRDSRGRKKRVIAVELVDPTLQKSNSQPLIAELSRPARKLKKVIKSKTRKPQGRKPKSVPRPAKYHNWFSPFAWSGITNAVKKAGWHMSASAIVKAAKQLDPVVFAGLARTTVNSWIDRSKARPCWTAAVLRRIEQGNIPGHDKGGQRGVLAQHPDIVNTVTKRLQKLRDAGAPCTVITMRAVILASIILAKPAILEIPYRDGSTFKASDSFVRKWVRRNLNWAERKATRTAQKVPIDWEDKCEQSFLRKAYSIKEYDIPSALFVNSDQTQVVYAPGDKMTYAPIGAKQVSLIGGDEKRAFTAMVSVSNSGELLPFQAIYEGKTSLACPSLGSENYENVRKAGMLIEPSGTKTYWSNHQTMHHFVDNILAPYFDRQRAFLGLPSSQKALWQIDVWSVHRSAEFRLWMTTHHPNIIIDFVPGGCTGLHQPCDVGIQRSFKHVIKRCYHEAIVNEMVAQIEDGSTVLTTDKRIKIVRDRSITWLWNAYTALNTVAFVKKSFAMCVVREWNLSYESLTSFEAREKLRNLKTEDPQFWIELSTEKEGANLPGPSDVVAEDDMEAELEQDLGYGDDSSIKINDVMRAGLESGGAGGSARIAERKGGRLITVALAEDEEEEPEEASEDLDGREQPATRGGSAAFTQLPQILTEITADSTNMEATGRGKRKRTSNRWYSQKNFIRHDDNDASDVE